MNSFDQISMKTRFTTNQRAALDGLIFLVLAFAILAWAFFVSGCAGPHNLPKDSAVIGGSQVSGVWGHGELKGVILTGKAATPENVAAAAKALPDVLK